LPVTDTGALLSLPPVVEAVVFELLAAGLLAVVAGRFVFALLEDDVLTDTFPLQAVSIVTVASRTTERGTLMIMIISPLVMAETKIDAREMLTRVQTVDDSA
jgi:hypothetical protein